MARHFKVMMKVVESISTTEKLFAHEKVICSDERDIVFSEKALLQTIYPALECELRLGRAAHEMKEALAIAMGTYLQPTK